MTFQNPIDVFNIFLKDLCTPPYIFIHVYMTIYGRVVDLGRLIDLLCLTLISVIFQLCHGNRFSGGRSRNTRREQSTMCMQLVNFINCVASRMHPFCYLQSRTRTHAVLLIGNPTIQLSEPPGPSICEDKRGFMKGYISLSLKSGSIF